MQRKDNREMPGNELPMPRLEPQSHSIMFDGRRFVRNGSGNEVRANPGDLLIFEQRSKRDTITITFRPAGIVVHQNGSPLPPDNAIQVVKVSIGFFVKISDRAAAGTVGWFEAEKDPPAQDTAEGKIIISGV